MGKTFLMVVDALRLTLGASLPITVALLAFFYFFVAWFCPAILCPSMICLTKIGQKMPMDFQNPFHFVREVRNVGVLFFDEVLLCTCEVKNNCVVMSTACTSEALIVKRGYRREGLFVFDNGLQECL